MTETPEPTCPVCIHADATGSVPPRHDCPDAHVTTDGDDTIKIVRGGTGPASLAGERDADGTGVPPATAPAPLHITALDTAYDTALDAWTENEDDNRSLAQLFRDTITDPANKLNAAEWLTETGFLVFAGSWVGPEGGVYHEHETPPPGAVPLFRIGGTS